MQSWPYAKASAARDYRISRLAVIKKNSQEIGLMVVQEIRLGPIHLVELNRGPLWFSDKNENENLKEFAALFNKTFPKRFLRRRRWIVESGASVEKESILAEAGFKKLPQTYETIWLDLRKSVDVLRSELHQKWRNALNKAEAANLEVVFDDLGEKSRIFFEQYARQKAQKNYRGTSSKFLQVELMESLVALDGFLLFAKEEKTIVAGVMVAMHGNSASYRAGWTTDRGRELNAHSLLLWKSMLKCQEKGLQSFDLGGVIPGEAEGLTQFKKRMGGEAFPCVGIFA